MELAQCLGLKFRHGSFSHTFGWVHPSKLFLAVMIGRKKFQIDIASFFKECWGKLSWQRRRALNITMPDTVFLRRCSDLELDFSVMPFSIRSSWEYRVAKSSLRAWLKRAQRVHADQKGRSATPEI